MTDMTDVDLEQGKVQVEVFTKTDAALAALEQECQETPDFTDPTGYEQGKERLNRLTKYRTTLEKERKRIKAPYLDACNIIDAEAKRITGRLVALEEPLKTAKQEVDEREKRQKEERIAKLQARIDAMRAKVREARGQDSDTVATLIEEVDAIDTQGEFYELRDDAVRIQREVLDELGAIYSDRVHAEQAERERAEAEQERARQQQEQKIERDIAAIRMTPLDLMGKPADTIRMVLNRMEHQWPATNQFGDRAHEAEQAHEQALTQLRGMLAQAEALEAAKTPEPEKTAEKSVAEAVFDDAMATGAGTMEASEQGTKHIPAADKVTTEEAIAEHQDSLDAFNASVADIMSAGARIDWEAAEAIVDAIIAGEVRHVTYSAE